MIFRVSTVCCRVPPLYTQKWKRTLELCSSSLVRLFAQLSMSQMELGLHAISGTGQNWKGRNDDLSVRMVSCPGSTVLDPKTETNT